jgi:hypothetical protein
MSARFQVTKLHLKIKLARSLNFNMANKIIHEELNDKQQAAYEEWLSHIKAIYGEYGLFTWEISPNGIGTAIEVYSHLTKTKLDLTDVDSW